MFMVCLPFNGDDNIAQDINVPTILSLDTSNLLESIVIDVMPVVPLISFLGLFLLLKAE